LGVHEALGHEVVVRPARGEEPRALANGELAFEDHVRVRDAERRGSGQRSLPVPVTVVHHQQRRQAIAVATPNPPAENSNRATVSGLNALVRPNSRYGLWISTPSMMVRFSSGDPPAHGDAAAQLVRGHHAGQGLDHVEDVVEPAGDGQDARAPPEGNPALPGRRGLDLHVLREARL
jgi:hypothetical protein